METLNREEQLAKIAMLSGLVKDILGHFVNRWKENPPIVEHESAAKELAMCLHLLDAIAIWAKLGYEHEGQAASFGDMVRLALVYPTYLDKVEYWECGFFGADDKREYFYQLKYVAKQLEREIRQLEQVY